jgi:hypothetical protein
MEKRAAKLRGNARCDGLDRSTAYDSQELKWPVYGECSMATIEGATRSIPVKLMFRLESSKRMNDMCGPHSAQGTSFIIGGGSGKTHDN